MTWPSTFESTPYYYDYPGTSKMTKYRDDIFVGYRFYETFGVDESFCFGHGRSYTSFEYSDFAVEKDEHSFDSMFRLSVTVKNTGKVSGREVCQFYVSKPGENGELRPARELCGFAKTKVLKPGQSQKVTVSVRRQELLSFSDEEKTLRIIDGGYVFSVGASSPAL